MRTIDAALQERLDSGATTLCRCWRVARRDGVVFGFTDHDRDLKIDGVAYMADSGMDASALQTATGLSVDNGQAVGALTADAITEADIRAGRFDDAEVSQWLVDWRRPDLKVLLFRGTLGEMRRSDGAFEVELRGLSERLNVPVGRSILKTCDRVLGDTKCRFDTDRSGFSAETTARNESGGTRIVCAGLSGFEDGWFRHGVLTWLSGGNVHAIGVVKGEKSLGGGLRALDLWQEPRVAIAAGDRFKVVAGCDKRGETCRQKFNNFLNFRGFPHVPGEDWVVAYPKEGSVHDGSSLDR